jgi:hypothetical protein
VKIVRRMILALGTLAALALAGGKEFFGPKQPPRRSKRRLSLNPRVEVPGGSLVSRLRVGRNSGSDRYALPQASINVEDPTNGFAPFSHEQKAEMRQP